MIHIKRKDNEILLWDYEGRNPIVFTHDEAVDAATKLLDEAGHMKQEQDEEATVYA